VEDGIHVLVAVLLTGLSLVLLVNVASDVVSALKGPYDALALLLAVLDKSLVLFIVAELLHSVRITIRDRALDAEPFLVVGLIAGIRRVLILTAQAETSFHWNPQGIELTILMALILVMAVAILAWRYSTRSRDAPPVG
jgi:uncharacterized membrane protein (DUF373 family)